MKPLIQKKGDLIKALQAGEVDYIMHCVNCQGVMAAGIAKQIKATFPNVYDKYKDYCVPVSHDSSDLLGHVLIVDNVINIFAQNNFGVHKKQLHYGALANCLQKVINNETFFRNMFENNKVTRIGVPKLMCCALAGGKWEVVSEMLEEFPFWIEIVVYDFN